MRKILKLPEGDKQINLSSCGPNAMKKVIAYKSGIDVPEHQLINMSCCSWANGAPINGMEQVARKFNLDYELKHNSSVDDIISSIDNNNPVVLLIQEWGSGHYVVANGYDDKYEKVFYYDPLYGKVKNINYSTLDKKWVGVDLFERDHFGIFFK
jgi:ABC-type bacteriocin/lantibiotic exporter with double-glycine peptidase domain